MNTTQGAVSAFNLFRPEESTVVGKFGGLDTMQARLEGWCGNLVPVVTPPSLLSGSESSAGHGPQPASLTPVRCCCCQQSPGPIRRPSPGPGSSAATLRTGTNVTPPASVMPMVGRPPTGTAICGSSCPTAALGQLERMKLLPQSLLRCASERLCWQFPVHPCKAAVASDTA